MTSVASKAEPGGKTSMGKAPHVRDPKVLCPLQQLGLLNLPIFQKQAEVSSLEAALWKSTGFQESWVSFSVQVVKFLRAPEAAWSRLAYCWLTESSQLRWSAQDPRPSVRIILQVLALLYRWEQDADIRGLVWALTAWGQGAGGRRETELDNSNESPVLEAVTSRCQFSSLTWVNVNSGWVTQQT